jgi:Flp pilus assembly protein TadB
MKLYIFVLSFLALPAFVLAHGMMDFDSSATGPEMMRYMEDRALASDELHEEMENLMVKMMTGKLTETEANRMVELMNQYPGPMGMMMGRLGMGQGMWGRNWPQNMMSMMNWGSGFNFFTGAWVWLVFLSVIVWLIVGILAAVWLWKKIQEK